LDHVCKRPNLWVQNDHSLHEPTNGLWQSLGHYWRLRQVLVEILTMLQGQLELIDVSRRHSGDDIRLQSVAVDIPQT
jgi:hypothetical protein